MNVFSHDWKMGISVTHESIVVFNCYPHFIYGLNPRDLSSSGSPKRILLSRRRSPPFTASRKLGRYEAISAEIEHASVLLAIFLGRDDFPRKDP